MNVWLHAGTRGLMQIFGTQLAADVTRAKATDLAPDESRVAFIAEGEGVLHALDRLDVGVSEELDRELQLLAVAEPQVWLELAEDGAFDGKDYIAHVLHHCGVGGYPGPRFVVALMEAVAAADEEHRNLLAQVFPEYVGLWRACTETADGAGRLRTLVGR